MLNNSERQEKVLSYLSDHQIPYTCYNHPEGKTIEEAKRWWRDDGSVHCKNIFMRNHKGTQHYLICFDCEHDLAIHDLEQRLKASLLAAGKNSPGKLSFASPDAVALSGMCVGRFAFDCWLVIAAAITVGLNRFPTLFWTIKTALTPPCSEPTTGLKSA